MSKRQKKQPLPKEILEYLSTIKITKYRADTGDRIKSIEKHLKNGDSYHADVQLRSLSKHAEKLHHDSEYIQYLIYLLSQKRDDADIPF